MLRCFYRSTNALTIGSNVAYRRPYLSFPRAKIPHTRFSNKAAAADITEKSIDVGGTDTEDEFAEFYRRRPGGFGMRVARRCLACDAIALGGVSNAQKGELTLHCIAH
jgi:hypothetical protein